jgi:hypothetical protein
LGSSYLESEARAIHESDDAILIVGSALNAATGFNDSILWRVSNCSAPVIHGCPSDIVVPNDPGTCGAVVNWLEPDVTAACGVQSLLGDHSPGEIFPEGSTTVTYTATDTAGQTTECTFNVTVTDTEPPEITCPTDISVQCLQNVPAPSFEGSVRDNCNFLLPVVHVSDILEDNHITRIYEAVDASGNRSRCVQTINIVELPGDLNGDCCVDQNDLALVLVKIRARSHDLTFDINRDGIVSIADARLVVLNFTNPTGTSCTAD